MIIVVKGTLHMPSSSTHYSISQHGKLRVASVVPEGQSFLILKFYVVF